MKAPLNGQNHGKTNGQNNLIFMINKHSNKYANCNLAIFDEIDKLN